MACVIRPSRHLEAIKFMKVDIKLNCRVSAGGDEESGRWERNIVSKLNAYRLHTHTHTLSRGFWYRKLRPSRNCVNRWCCGRPISQFYSTEKSSPPREIWAALRQRKKCKNSFSTGLRIRVLTSMQTKQNKAKRFAIIIKWDEPAFFSRSQSIFIVFACSIKLSSTLQLAPSSPPPPTLASK